MDKCSLEEHLNDGMSYGQISRKYKITMNKVKSYAKKYNLKSKHEKKVIKDYKEGDTKYCPSCNKDLDINLFYFWGKNKKYAAYCGECDKVKNTERQINMKAKCVEYKGGKCLLCGYNKYYGALQFHHLNPKEKDFAISNARTSTLNERVIKELDKCVLLCGNCHSEVEAGISILSI